VSTVTKLHFVTGLAHVFKGREVKGGKN
jgi:hypothetical protein